VAALFLIVLRVVKAAFVRRATTIARKTATQVDDLLVDLAGKTKTFSLILLSLYAGSLVLVLPELAARCLRVVAISVTYLQGAIWINALVVFLLDRYVHRRMEHDPAEATTASVIGFISRLVLWSLVVLLALDNLGVDVTAMIAGLGVTGIAVALAAQSILGDLFSSLAIALDRPFVVGDFIIVGDLMGTVERVGLRTTRITSLWGEQLVFNNGDLLASRIRNYKRMRERRIQFALGVTYQTPHDTLVAIPGLIREAVEEQERARFDRAHFKDYGDFSLNFEVVYYVLSPDYNLYMDVQQAINLSIHQKFEEAGIEFAYPTQTLFVEKPA